MEMSSEIKDIAEALALAQAEIESAEKDRVNPHFRSSYATLASVWEACRAPLTKNGISVVQSPNAQGPIVTLTTVLLHKSGQWFRDVLTLRAVNETPQSVGSAITYGRRYALAAMVGVAPDDDDGNAGSGKSSEERVDRSTGEITPASTPDYRPAPSASNGQHAPRASSSYENPARDFIKDIQSKSGPKKDGSTFTRYSIETKSNGFFTTFNPAFADIAMEAKNKGEAVIIGYRANGRWKDIEDIRLDSSPPVSAYQDDVDALPF